MDNFLWVSLLEDNLLRDSLLRHNHLWYCLLLGYDGCQGLHLPKFGGCSLVGVHWWESYPKYYIDSTQNPEWSRHNQIQLH